MLPKYLQCKHHVTHFTRRQVVRGTVSDSMVLPPGEFNGIITRPLPVYSESFMAICLTLFRNVADSYAYKQTFITTLQNVIV